MNNQSYCENPTKSWLAFKAGGECFALPVENVTCIVEFSRITKIPGAPHYLKGVINHRGKSLPVIDLCTRLGIKNYGYSLYTCILAINCGTDYKKRSFGLKVDMVYEIKDIKEKNIQQVDSKNGFIIGIAQDKFLGKVKLLDSEKLSSGSVFESVVYDFNAVGILN